MTDIYKNGLVHLAGARTNFLRTLSKIIWLGAAFRLRRQSDISSNRAAHYTADFVAVNTLPPNFFLPLPSQNPTAALQGREL